MDRCDLHFRGWAPTIVDDFEPVPTPEGGTRVRRATTVQVIGPFGWVKRAMLWVGLKKVHRFVFRNWQRLAVAAAPPNESGVGAPQPHREVEPSSCAQSVGWGEEKGTSLIFGQRQTAE